METWKAESFIKLSGNTSTLHCRFSQYENSGDYGSTMLGEETSGASRFCSFYTNICMRSDLIRTVHNPLVIHQFQNVNRGSKYKTSVAIQSRVRHLRAPKRWSRMEIPNLPWGCLGYLVGRKRDLLWVEQTMENKIWKMRSQVYNCDRLVPLWVDCPKGYYGASPCCKMKQGLALLHGMHTKYDFFSYQDDDMYIRIEYMDQFVAGLNASDVFVLTSKPLNPLGKTFGKDHHECSTSTDYMYPRGQPVHWATLLLDLPLDPSRRSAKILMWLDVGNPLIHWMYMIP